MPTLDFTAVPRFRSVFGNRRQILVKYTGPSSYATGGDSLVASDVGLGVIENIPEQMYTNGTNIFSGIYNQTTGKMQFFDTGTKAEVAAATNLSGYSSIIEVEGY